MSLPATHPPPPLAKWVEVDAGHAGQRIDNFLIKQLKGVPKTRLYRALRTGEVRVNGGRIKAPYQLRCGDQVRIPPLRYAAPKADNAQAIPPNLLRQIPILYQDADLMIVNKPAGLAVHGGSAQAFGLIEAFRALAPTPYLELAHRLDRDTSGCLVLCKSRAALVALQQQLRVPSRIKKHYTALLIGNLAEEQVNITTGLRTLSSATTKKRSQVDPSGRFAHSVLRVSERFAAHTLVDIELKTGRMHQARAHTASVHHPIAGDTLYGDPTENHRLQKLGLGRLFLHARKLVLMQPLTGQRVQVRAMLPPQLAEVLAKLR